MLLKVFATLEFIFECTRKVAYILGGCGLQMRRKITNEIEIVL